MLQMILSGEPAEAARRALFTVATADGSLDPRERLFLDVQEELGESQVPPESLQPISPADLQRAISEPEVRRALLQRLVMMTMMDEVIHPEEVRAVRSFAKALDIDEPAVAQMERLAKRRLGLFALDLARRGFLAKPLKKMWHEQGLRGLWAMRPTGPGVPELARRHQGLEQLPATSLGRAYFEYFRKNGFPLCGEKAGPPETLFFHDLGHVLTGYGTDPAGELQMMGFEAGYMKEDGFSVVVLGLTLYQLGMAPPGDSAKPSTGAFEQKPFRAAYAKGLGLKQDLRDFDLWRHVEKPLEEVRASLGMS